MTNQRDAAEAVYRAKRSVSEGYHHDRAVITNGDLRLVLERLDALASLPAASEGEPVACDDLIKRLLHPSRKLLRVELENTMSEAAVALLDAGKAPSDQEKLQHVAYFDEGQFHWMSGIAPRDCELYAKWHSRARQNGS